MPTPDQLPSRRVLIASSHSLFGLGLRNLLQERQGAAVEIVGMVSNLDEALQALEQLNPDLIIVDYDDEKLNRDEFMARFVEGEKKLRVVLLSLQSPREAVVYDRRTLAAAQIDDWLEEWSLSDDASRAFNQQRETPRSMNMINRLKKAKHFIAASILVAVVSALLILGLQSVQILPIEASAQAVPIDQMFRIEFAVIAVLFSLIVVFMVYSIAVFRRKKGDLSDARHIEGSTGLEVAWTIAPLGIVMVFAYLGGNALAATVRPEPKPLRVEVIGKQWVWNFVYPDYGFSSDKLYLPENRQALLLLSSEDVIHSFWVPEFRVKQDALPGGKQFVRELRVEPTQKGNFWLRCAELCGQRHTYMEAEVIVSSQADFDVWAAKESGLSADPVERGNKWAKQYGCVACHSIDGSKLVGPSWKGLYGRQETMTNGTTVTADDTYIKESILNPGALVVQGYPAGVMPAQFIDPVSKKPISDAQILDIIEFIKTLK
jgi:cytochrome c oxidase subunit II